jgi:hypothetical protein
MKVETARHPDSGAFARGGRRELEVSNEAEPARGSWAPGLSECRSGIVKGMILFALDLAVLIG